MIYNEVKPHAALANSIDAFWMATGDGKKRVTEKILPDGCVDIIINFGEDCLTDNGTFSIENEKSYQVGTMTRFKINDLSPETKLVGVRFKPAAFSSFYGFTPLHEIKDRTIEFEKSLAPDFKKLCTSPIACLNQFFLNRRMQTNHNLEAIIADIEKHMGRISVSDMASRHFTTIKQLERYFNQYIGISPKEFINFVRYQSVLPVIQDKSAGRSLMDIAFEYGYYDHAHLTNEIKRYTGMAPSQF